MATRFNIRNPLKPLFTSIATHIRNTLNLNSNIKIKPKDFPLYLESFNSSIDLMENLLGGISTEITEFDGMGITTISNNTLTNSHLIKATFPDCINISIPLAEAENLSELYLPGQHFVSLPYYCSNYFNSIIKIYVPNNLYSKYQQTYSYHSNQFYAIPNNNNRTNLKTFFQRMTSAIKTKLNLSSTQKINLSNIYSYISLISAFNKQNQDFIDYINYNLTSYNNSTISSIISAAFAYQTNLSYISLFNCQAINYPAFAHCVNLKELYLPNCNININPQQTFLNLDFHTYNTIFLPKLTIGMNLSSYYITNLTIGDTTIKRDACQHVYNLNAPLCTTILSQAFQGNSEIYFGSFENCSIIQASVFKDCTNLQAISLPNCELIYEQAFENCISLSQINLPNCISIGNLAFASCSKLQEIILPNCTSFVSTAFWRTNISIISCPKITFISNQGAVTNASTLTFPDVEIITNNFYNAAVNIRNSTLILPKCSLISKANGVLGPFCRLNGSLKTIYLPNLQVIPAATFTQTSIIQTIILSNCITIQDQFNGMTNLNALYLMGSSVTALTASFFHNPIVESSTSGFIYVPRSLITAYQNANNWSNYANKFLAIEDYPLSNIF